MTPDQILKRIPILLSLPIPGEPGYETAKIPEIWDEPFDYFELWSQVKGQVPDSADWEPPISCARVRLVEGACHDKLARSIRKLYGE